MHITEHEKLLKELIHNFNLIVVSRTESLNVGKLVGNLFQNLILAIWFLAIELGGDRYGLMTN